MQTIEQWITQLQGEDQPAQIAAAQALGDTGDPRAYMALQPYASEFRREDQLRSVSRTAVEQLQAALTPDVLLKLLIAEDAAHRRAAAQLLLGMLSPRYDIPMPQAAHLKRELTDSYPIYAGLKAALTDRDAQVRLLAVQALGHLYDTSADRGEIVTLMLPLASADPSAEVRTSALYVLGMFGDYPQPEVMAVIVAALRDPDGAVRGQAGREIGWFADRGWDHVSVVAAMGEAGKEQLIANLSDPAPEARQGAIEALYWLHIPESVEAIIAALSDTDAYVRQRAAITLGIMRAERAIVPLLALLEDPDEMVRTSAADAFHYLRSPQVTAALIDRIRAEEDNIARMSIARSLGALGDPAAIPALVQVAEADEALAGIAAAQALLELGDARGFDLLLRHREGSFYSTTKESVIATLAHIGALPDRQAATYHHVHLPYGMSSKTRGMFSDGRCIAPLLAYLTDRNTEVRRLAVAALALVGDAGVVDALIPLLDDSAADDDRFGHLGPVGKTAADALQIIGTQAAWAAVLIWRTKHGG